jgi:N-acetylmuramoyl-L-alanine amidase
MMSRWLLLVFFWLGLNQAALALTFNTVVIDAGHGGKDGGCAWNGLVEKKICLDTALRLERILKAKGLRVVMTRRSDVFIDLEDRARLANRYSKAIFVSIHFNASKLKSRSGMEVFYRSANGKVLASSILRKMDNNLKGLNRGVSHNDFKVLTATAMPAVLIECAYLSNLTEARRCATSAHRQELAQSIAAGILATKS